MEAYALAPEDPLPQPRPLPEPVTPPGLWDGSYSSPAEISLMAGHVVVLTGAGLLALARADAEATARVVGVVVQGAAVGHAAQWTVDRPVERTDWSPVLESGAAQLVPGTAYFLSAVLAGGIIDTPPATPGASRGSRGPRGCPHGVARRPGPAGSAVTRTAVSILVPHYQ